MRCCQLLQFVDYKKQQTVTSNDQNSLNNFTLSNGPLHTEILQIFKKQQQHTHTHTHLPNNNWRTSNTSFTPSQVYKDSWMAVFLVHILLDHVDMNYYLTLMLLFCRFMH